jgi:spermidine synthase
MEIMISEEKGVRYLHFGSQWIQGAMRIARPWALEFEYTQEMMLPLLLKSEKNWPKSALLIGLGSGALAKFLHRHRPNCRITIVEISNSVVVAAQMHFKLPDFSPYFQVELGCGAEYMANATRSFDLIMVDGFDANAKVGDLNSSRFYLNAKAKLNDGGMMVANLLSKPKDAEQSLKRLYDSFDDRAIALSKCESGNVVAFATVGNPLEIKPDDLTDVAIQLKTDTGLNLSKTVVKLQTQEKRFL